MHYEEATEQVFALKNTSDVIKYMYVCLITYNNLDLTLDQFADQITMENVTDFIKELEGSGKKKVMDPLSRLKKFLRSLF